MNPTRAAWFFAAGLAWLVLRGILVQAFPVLRPESVAEQGGPLLIVPFLSVVASATIPLFFVSYLSRSPFDRRPVLRIATLVAVAASVAAFLLVLVSFARVVRGLGPGQSQSISTPSGPLTFIPLLLGASILFFLIVFARQGTRDPVLRRAAVIGAVGTAVPVVLITAWIIHGRFEGALPWYPAFSQSLAARVIGLAAAGGLLWFLETFAVRYEATDDVGRPD
jgi:hypothetical protein